MADFYLLSDPLQRTYADLREKIELRRKHLQSIGKPHGPGSYDGALNSMIAQCRRLEAKMNKLASELTQYMQSVDEFLQPDYSMTARDIDIIVRKGMKRNDIARGCQDCAAFNASDCSCNTRWLHGRTRA